MKLRIAALLILASVAPALAQQGVDSSQAVSADWQAMMNLIGHVGQGVSQLLQENAALRDRNTKLIAENDKLKADAAKPKAEAPKASDKPKE